MTRASLLVVALLAFLLLPAAGCPVKPGPAGQGGSPSLGGSPAVAGDSGLGGGLPVWFGGTAGQVATGGQLADDGLAACIVGTSASEGVRNVAAQSGKDLASAVAEICSSPALRRCFAEGHCK